MRDMLTQSKEVEFVLDSERTGTTLLETDPRNWNDDEKRFELDKESKGVLRKINTKLEFAKDGFDILYGHALSYPMDTAISISKYGKDVTSRNESNRLLYQSYLDMPKAEFDLDRKLAKVPFTQGGLYDRIKARMTNKYDIVTKRSANGKEITDLSTITEQVSGRQIFRRSIGAVEDGVGIDHPVSGNDEDVARAVVFTIDPNSDIDNIKNVPVGTESVPYNDGDYAAGQLGSLLFTRSDRLRTRRINGKVKITLDPAKVHSGFIRLEKVFYKFNKDSNTYEYIANSRKALAQVSTNVPANVLEYEFIDDRIVLDTDEAMALALYSNTDNGIGYFYDETSIEITEDDSYPPTSAKCILPHELFERLLEKITGEKGLFISNVLGRVDLGYDTDGEWAYLATSSGFWARAFDLSEKQYTISLKDALDSFNAVFPVMWFIETRQGKECLRLEKYEYGHQSFDGIQLGRTINGTFNYIKAANPEVTLLYGNLYTGAKIGFEKGGNDYEEVSGLSSPHGFAEFNTSLESIDENIYVKLSKIRADVEGHELARQKQANLHPDEDTSYDQEIFFRHLKKVGNQYFLRTWQDDFDSVPQGESVYSPNTMGNLLLTPFRCLLRHSRLLATSVYKDPTGTVNWISSNCFSDFTTTRTGESALNEKGSILNEDLGEPFITEFLLKFDGKVFQEMVDQIEGHTYINGERIPNYFGKYLVMVGTTLYEGKLNKVEINGEGKHEVVIKP